MMVSETTRATLEAKRDDLEKIKEGWGRIDESGGELWKLHRGSLIGHRITDVAIAADGRTLWVKISPTRIKT